jgi:hypothetical protein
LNSSTRRCGKAALGKAGMRRLTYGQVARQAALQTPEEFAQPGLGRGADDSDLGHD